MTTMELSIHASATIRCDTTGWHLMDFNTEKNLHPYGGIESGYKVDKNEVLLEEEWL